MKCLRSGALGGGEGRVAASVAGCCHISTAASTSPNQGQEIEPEAGVL